MFSQASVILSLNGGGGEVTPNASSDRSYDHGGEWSCLGGGGEVVDVSPPPPSQGQRSTTFPWTGPPPLARVKGQPLPLPRQDHLPSRIHMGTTVNVDAESLRLRLRYFARIQIGTPATIKSPVSRQFVSVIILVFFSGPVADFMQFWGKFGKIVCWRPLPRGVGAPPPLGKSWIRRCGHPQFNYGWCPNLNLSEISQSQSEAKSIQWAGGAHPECILVKSKSIAFLN